MADSTPQNSYDKNQSDIGERMLNVEARIQESLTTTLQDMAAHISKEVTNLVVDRIESSMGGQHEMTLIAVSELIESSNVSSQLEELKVRLDGLTHRGDLPPLVFSRDDSAHATAAHMAESERQIQRLSRQVNILTDRLAELEERESSRLHNDAQRRRNAAANAPPIEYYRFAEDAGSFAKYSAMTANDKPRRRQTDRALAALEIPESEYDEIEQGKGLDTRGTKRPATATDSDEDWPVPKVKARKRSKIAAQGTSKAVDAPQVKRKPGRPRKNPVVDTPGVLGKPKTDSVPIAQGPKRKQGRPRKHSVVSAIEVESAAAPLATIPGYDSRPHINASNDPDEAIEPIDQTSTQTIDTVGELPIDDVSGIARTNLVYGTQQLRPDRDEDLLDHFLGGN